MQLFGSNTPAILQYLLAFVIILGVLAVLVAILRRITGNNNRVRPGYAGSSARHRQQRLGVVDAVDIDAQRQLLLLRRDNVEHLVLIGGPNDLLVESGIGRLPYRLPLHAQHAETGEEQADHSARHDAPAESSALAGADAVAESARAALDPATASGPTPPRATLPPPLPPRSLATPVAAPVVPGPASATRPASAAPQAIPEVEPPLAPAATGTAGGTSGSNIFAAEPPRKDAPHPSRPPAKGPFSAVARQLDEALKRPFAAVRPSPVTGIDLDGDTAASREAGAASGAPVPPPAVQSPPAVQAPVPPAENRAAIVAGEAPGSSGSPIVEPSDQMIRAKSPLSASWFPVHDTARPTDSSPDSRTVAATARALSATSPASAPPVSAPVADRRPPASTAADDAPAVKVPAAGQAVSSSPFAAPVTSPAVSPRVSPPAAPEVATPQREETTPVSTTAQVSANAPASAKTQVSASAPQQEKIAPVEAGDVVDTLKVPDALKAPTGGKDSQPEGKSSFDLSSLENIEAEFARLLGRSRPDGKDK